MLFKYWHTLALKLDLLECILRLSSSLQESCRREGIYYGVATMTNNLGMT